MPTEQHDPLKVFISYSHKDRNYLLEMHEHFHALIRVGLIEMWWDGEIKPGDRWDKVIGQKMEESDIIILLISADYIASEFCYQKEMETALTLHESRQATVIPVIVRPCSWEITRFAVLQVLPNPAIPIANWSNRDEAWTNVVNGIHTIIREVVSPPNPFQIDRPVVGNNFLGRNQIIESVLHDDDFSHGWVMGPRKSGKTSLLKQLKVATEQRPQLKKKLIPFYWGMEGVQNAMGL
jgi:hypothetical protein